MSKFLDRIVMESKESTMLSTSRQRRNCLNWISISTVQAPVSEQ